VVWGKFIGKEDGFMDGVGFCRVDGIGREDYEDENERVYPGVFEGDLLPFS
jgi:hypothetical protein